MDESFRKALPQPRQVGPILIYPLCTENGISFSKFLIADGEIGLL